MAGIVFARFVQTPLFAAQIAYVCRDGRVENTAEQCGRAEGLLQLLFRLVGLAGLDEGMSVRVASDGLGELQEDRFHDVGKRHERSEVLRRQTEYGSKVHQRLDGEVRLRIGGAVQCGERALMDRDGVVVVALVRFELAQDPETEPGSELVVDGRELL